MAALISASGSTAAVLCSISCAVARVQFITVQVGKELPDFPLRQTPLDAQMRHHRLHFFAVLHWC